MQYYDLILDSIFLSQVLYFFLDLTVNTVNTDKIILK